jgi:hypothetical protein
VHWYGAPYDLFHSDHRAGRRPSSSRHPGNRAYCYFWWNDKGLGNAWAESQSILSDYYYEDEDDDEEDDEPEPPPVTRIHPNRNNRNRR